LPRQNSGIFVPLKLALFDSQGGNIIYIDQHVDKESDELFYALRNEFSEEKFSHQRILKKSLLLI